MTRPEGNIEWLYRRQRMGWTLGLERTRALLAAVGDPQASFRSVLVGGTNGKGSTARVLSECLGGEGGSVALFTSPHLSRLGERFVVDGLEVPAERVEAALRRLRPVAEEQQASFFEVLTVAACLLFAEAGVRWAVLEVGLGGRFDATNALEPELSIVTGIALDHTDLLGATVAEIAREKAGIMRRDRLVLTAARGEALEVLRDEAASREARLWVQGEEIRVEGELLGWQGQKVAVSCPAGVAEGVSPLVGAQQRSNLGLAAAAALTLGVAPAEVAEGLARAHWPGRLERVRWRGRWIVFDGAHNAQAAEALAAALALLEKEPFTLVVGMGKDKDLDSLAQALGPLAGRTYATRARFSPRARSATEVAAAFGSVAEAVEDPVAALERAVAGSRESETIVVAGSLYLVGELRPQVLDEGFEAVERWQ